MKRKDKKIVFVTMMVLLGMYYVVGAGGMVKFQFMLNMLFLIFYL